MVTENMVNRLMAENLARRLILDDLSRVDECPVERDGVRAVAGWFTAASQAGDSDTLEDIRQVGLDALADAWDELIDVLVPESE